MIKGVNLTGGEVGRRLDALQVLRALAAGMVVFVHAFSTYEEKIGPLPDIGLNYSLGSLGVKIFFCISGFIIFTSASALEPGAASVSFFARRRLIRIVPLYWCATVIYAFKLSLQGTAPEIMALINSLLFVPFGDSTGLMRPVLGPGWTLNYEMFFYVLLGLTLFFSKRFRLPIVSLFLLFMVLVRGLGLVEASSSFFLHAIFLLADSYLLFFLAGMVVGSLAKVNFLPRNKITPLGWGVTSFIVVLLIAVFIVVMPTLKLGSEVLTAFELLLCGTCVWACIKASDSDHLVKSNSARRYFVLAGDGSYSTYLTHGFVMGPAARILSAVHINISPWVFSFGMIFVCTVVGMFIYLYFEQPLLKNLNARWGVNKKSGINFLNAKNITHR